MAKHTGTLTQTTNNSLAALPSNPSSLQNPGDLSKPSSNADIHKPSGESLKNPTHHETVNPEICDPLKTTCPKDKALPHPADKSIKKSPKDPTKQPEKK